MRKLLFIFLLISVVLFGVSVQLRDTSHISVVDRLAQSLKVLEMYQVQGFRNHDWCKYIVYSRGAFSNSTRSTCNLFSVKPQPFDQQAQTDFDRVAAALESTKIDILYITDIQDDASHTLITAEFHQNSFWDYRSFVYAPAYTSLPQDIPGEQIHTRINEDWYYVWMEWM